MGLVSRSAAFLSVVTLTALALPALAGDREILVTPNYRIFGDETPKLKTIASYLEVSCADYGRRFRTPRGPGGKMRVRLFASGEAIAATMDSPNRSSFNGLYSPGEHELLMNANVESDEELFRLVRHEGFHQFADFHYGSKFPTWMEEGLACYFGNAELDGRTIKHRRVDQGDVDSLLESWHERGRPALTWLLEADYDTFHRSGNEHLNYMVAWLFCAWLIEDARNGQDLLNAYIEELSRDPGARFLPKVGEPEKVEAKLQEKLLAMRGTVVLSERPAPTSRRPKERIRTHATCPPKRTTRPAETHAVFRPFREGAGATVVLLANGGALSREDGGPAFVIFGRVRNEGNREARGVKVRAAVAGERGEVDVLEATVTPEILAPRAVGTFRLVYTGRLFDEVSGFEIVPEWRGD